MAPELPLTSGRTVSGCLSPTLLIAPRIINAIWSGHQSECGDGEKVLVPERERWLPPLLPAVFIRSRLTDAAWDCCDLPKLTARNGWSWPVSGHYDLEPLIIK